jgi:hypothetical protein
MCDYTESLRCFQLETLVILIEDLQGQVEEGTPGAENRLNKARSVYYDRINRRRNPGPAAMWELMPFAFAPMPRTRPLDGDR